MLLPDDKFPLLPFSCVPGADKDEADDVVVGANSLFSLVRSKLFSGLGVAVGAGDPCAAFVFVWPLQESGDASTPLLVLAGASAAILKSEGGTLAVVLQDSWFASTATALPSATLLQKKGVM
eukprot:g13426.t1